MNKIITFTFSFLTFLSLGDSLSVNSTYMNQYNDFLKKYKKEFSQERFLTFKENSKFIENFNNDNTIVPLNVDWRKKDAVTGVKNQGQCGGCWAFSATGAVEGVVAINTGELYNISEQQLIDCSTEEGNHGCEGGLMDQAFQYIIDHHGLCSEKEYPYNATTNQCNSATCENVVKISNYSDVISSNEKALKRAVAQQPVSVAIQANTQSFQHYAGGIYSDINCGTQLDHGVLVVGYGTELLKGIDYWIVKNSWGESWGDNGYIKILRNFNDSRGLCGIAMQPSFPNY
jgi:KDEL-tailed cysteine endopeptidase